MFSSADALVAHIEPSLFPAERRFVRFLLGLFRIQYAFSDCAEAFALYIQPAVSWYIADLVEAAMSGDAGADAKATMPRDDPSALQAFFEADSQWMAA